VAGNNKLLKELNQATILELIRVNKAISKADIASITGLSPNATGMITLNLINDDFLYVSGIGESSGGRKPDLLSLKPNSYYSMGVDIDTDRIRFALIDITGQIIYRSRIAVNCVGNYKATFEIINSEIKKNYKDKLLGVGFAIAGQVDAKSETIISAPNLKWKNINILDVISIDVPVFLENESITSSIYENWSGICQGVQNFICINSKSGIGAGIFINGKIYKGASGSAGEVGHIIVDIGGPKCECGSNGCLETYSSSLRLAEKLNVGSINEVILLARSGNQFALDALKQSALYIGVVISGLVNTLNPEKIVLGKQFVKYADLIIDEIKDVVNNKALPMPASNVEIVVSEEGEQSSVLGAAILPLINIFSTNEKRAAVGI